MIHLTLKIGQQFVTYCGSDDFKETMRAEHYFGHVVKEDCCKELRDKVCHDCLETWVK